VPIVVLVILALLWAVVLVPPLLRARTVRSADSIDDFHYRLDVLGRTQGTAPIAAPAPPVPTAPPAHPAVAAPARVARPARSTPGRLPSGAAKRRRDVMTVLFGAVAATFLLAYGTGAAFLWGAQVVADVLFVAYLALYAWFRSLHAERDRKVRYLPQRQPELLLRRSASS